MAGHPKVNVEKLPVRQVKIQVDSKIFEAFQKKLRQQGIPMNLAIEVFCRQYANGEYNFFSKEDITKWENNSSKELSILNTPVNKEAYCYFKDVVKAQGFYVKNVLSAFIENYAKNEMILEFVKK